MRTLLIIPIIHGEQDMGSLREGVKREYVQRYGQDKWDEHLRTINEVWGGIRAAIEALDLPFEKVKLYQDGLPVCGREGEIVRDVAEQGSRNHRLLLDLMAKGARLIGTEDPQLLLREYQMLQAAMGGTAPPAEDAGHGLLAERDRSIAARINATLRAGEIGLLFLGLAHEVGPLLDADILVRNLLPSLGRGTPATTTGG